MPSNHNTPQLTVIFTLELVLKHDDGKTEVVPVKHTFTKDQIEWFKAGSALNLIRARAQKAATG